MVSLTELTRYTNKLLNVSQFQDYCPNGLQVEGRAEIKKIVSGVTACQALIDIAIEKEADVLLVHHGYFWKNESPVITGVKKKRIQALLANGISLLAYHLPLDAHKELGNNVQLAQRLGFDIEGWFAGRKGQEIACHGALKSVSSAEALQQSISAVLHREALHIPGAAKEIKSIAWCTGAAQGYIEDAIALGVDAYISGEVSESTVHAARESGVHFFSCGHHATERYGVQALAAHLSEKFALAHEFVDIDNPV
ncbi:MAG: Nif3-like dinuclear metal center hexameric protein [Gammaproteobacteria bacterium]|nr:Nif3-like dinuclear metal center hexameric protein [Gammaproteobacteria bacterium]